MFESRFVISDQINGEEREEFKGEKAGAAGGLE